MTSVTGKIALVTGGASGIGLGLARALAGRGAQVVLADIDGERAAAQAAPIGARAVQLDVTDGAAWGRVAAEIGPVQILCGNAGVGGGPGAIDGYDVEAWHWIFGVNVDAHLHAMRAFLPAMKASGEGCHVLLTASMAGLVPTPHSIAYVASKFGAVGLAFGLRSELKGSNVGVSLLCPGIVATRIIETSTALRPNERAGIGTTMADVQSMLAAGMDPDRVGAMAVDAIAADRFYVFPHPEWKDLFAAQSADILAGVGESAQPGYADDLSGFLRNWHAA